MRTLFFLLLSVCLSPAWSQFSGRAKWIIPSCDASAPNQWLCYRKTIDIQDIQGMPVMASIAADSKYWLYINGELVVFEGGLQRGPTPDDGYYDQIDISSYLKEGKNTLAALVWFFGKDGFSHKNSGKAGFIFECRLSNQHVCSDSSWRAIQHPSFGNTDDPNPNYRLPESNIRFDARLDIPGWQQQGFDDSKWPAAKEEGQAGNAPWNRLWLRPVPLWTYDELSPYMNGGNLTGISQGKPLHALLPKNLSVIAYMKIEASEGQVIDIRTDDYMGGNEPNLRAEYITRGGIQEFESPAWLNGHEVIYSIPKGIHVLDLKYRHTGFNTNITGSFECNDTFYNSFCNKAVNTMLLNMRDGISDCPDRERAQWWGDIVITQGEILYMCDSNGYKAITKAMSNLVEWQKMDGTLYSPVPAGNWTKELPQQSLASIGKLGFWYYYMHTGDKKELSYVYPAVQRYLSLWKTGPDGLIEYRPGDWDWTDWGQHVDAIVAENAWYYMALKSAADMALILGIADDAAYYRKKSEEIKRAFNEELWKGNAYRSAGTAEADDRGNALAVISGIAGPERWNALKQVFLTKFHASCYMEKYVLEACFIMQDPKLAMDRMKRRYQKMIASPLTTLWEGWDIQSAEYGGGTYNHGWTGGPLTLLMQYVAGISPVKPGYQSFQVLPQPGSLTDLHAVASTPRGPISVEIHVKPDAYNEKIIAPECDYFTVGIPVKEKSYKEIRMNGAIVWENELAEENEEITFSGKRNGYLLFRVISLKTLDIAALF
jgi:alpha-L-rhamnosidase